MSEPVADSLSDAPKTVARYAAYLWAKADLTPEIRMDKDKTVLTASCAGGALMLTFTRQQKMWVLRGIEARRGEETARFSQGQVTAAIAWVVGASRAESESHEQPDE